MSWREIELDDIELFHSYLSKKNYCISDINFTNLYMWSCTRSISYKIVDDMLCIRTIYPNEEPFIFMPIGDGNPKEAIKSLKNEVRVINSVTPKMMGELGDEFVYEPKRERFDYVYSVEELIELKGRKFHGKKNHFYRFLESNRFEYEPITKENCNEIITVYNKWFSSYGETIPQSLRNEKVAMEKAFEAIDTLGFKGAIVRVEGEIVAFSFGEELTQDTVVIHIEKANTEYHGAYQVINQQFLERQWKSYRFVNREEDLGLEGLRKAKLSYNPTHFIEKYQAVLRSN